jgi:hypothetical protein
VYPFSHPDVKKFLIGYKLEGKEYKKESTCGSNGKEIIASLSLSLFCMFRILILKRSKTLKIEKKLHLSFFESEDIGGACGLQHCKKGIFRKGLGSDSYYIQYEEERFSPM